MNETIRVEFTAEVSLGNIHSDCFYIRLPKKINWKEGDVVLAMLELEKIPGESEVENDKT